MKRDMELVRKILFNIEENINNVPVINLKVDGYTMDQVAYHCSLLYEGGYINICIVNLSSEGVYSFKIGRLTWEGHEFLDKIREDTIWNKTKDIITSKGLPFVFDVVKSVASEIITGFVKTALGM